MTREEFISRSEAILLSRAMAQTEINRILEGRLYESFAPGFKFQVRDCIKLLVDTTHADLFQPAPQPAPQVIVIQQPSPTPKTTKKNDDSLTITAVLVVLVLILAAIFFIPSVKATVFGFFGNMNPTSSGSSDCGQSNSTYLNFVEMKTKAGQTIISPEKTPRLVDSESYICFADDEMGKFYAQSIQTDQGSVDGRMALASLITSETSKSKNKEGDNVWKKELYNKVYSAIDPALFLPMDKAGFSYAILPALITSTQAATPLPGQKSPQSTQPNSQPVIPTSTQLIVSANNQTAFEKYSAIVGEDAAKTAFTQDPGQQCYAAFVAKWEDFTGNTPLTEVLKLLGPAGYSIQPNNTAHLARTWDKDASGYSGCVTISNVTTTYPQGSWRISTFGEIATIHWFPGYGTSEVQAGNIWISSVYSDQPTPQPTPPPTPIVEITYLRGWMAANLFTELYTPNCPIEPLRGQVPLTTLGGNTYVVIVDFVIDTAAALRYSQYDCTQAGGLHFYASDPGKGGAQLEYLNSVFVWPMSKATVQWPTTTPGGPANYPPDGSKISLADLLLYLDGVGQKTAYSMCSGYVNGYITGWPTEVPIRMNAVTYLVDFSPISARLETTVFCHDTTVNGKLVPGQNINLTLSSIGSPGGFPWITWNGWYISPFK